MEELEGLKHGEQSVVKGVIAEVQGCLLPVIAGIHPDKEWVQSQMSRMEI